jgi:hypothetical protein
MWEAPYFNCTDKPEQIHLIDFETDVCRRKRCSRIEAYESQRLSLTALTEVAGKRCLGCDHNAQAELPNSICFAEGDASTGIF